MLLYFCNDFQNEPWRNVEEGVYWAKFSLEHSTLPDINILITDFLRQYYDSFLQEGGTEEAAEYAMNGYQYLYEQRRCFEKVSADKQADAEKRLFDIIFVLLGYYFEIEPNRFILMTRELEGFENEVPRFAGVVRYLRGYALYLTGEECLKEGSLQEAQQCLQKSLELGYEESAKYLSRFKTTMFGKLVFR